MGRSPLLSGRALTYKPAGLTLADGDALHDHAGFRVRERTAPLGTHRSWEDLTAALLQWQVKRRSGFRVVDDDGIAASAVVTGDRYWLVAKLGPWRVREPVRVVGVVHEPDRVGFAYGTLEGHPLSGEEAFLVHRDADGAMHLTIRSVSRPASGAWYLAFPFLVYTQVYFRKRYFRALD